MKKLFFLSFLLCATSVFAQKKTPLEVCSELLNAKVFVEYAKFKKDFEQLNKNLAPQLPQKDFDELNVAYNTVQKQYDDFLGLIQKDVQDYATIKRMVKDPSKFVGIYSAAYQDVVDNYKKDYLPIHARLSKKNAKGIPPMLIALGANVFQIVIDIIQKRDELKQEHVSNVLAVVNSYFFDKLRMKKWHELNLSAAAEGTSVVSTTTASSSTENTGARRGGATSSNALPSALNEPSPVNPPVFDKIEGFVEFIYLLPDGKEEKMNFAKKGGKDIIITSRKVNNGQVQTQNNTLTTDFLTTEKGFDEGTQYYIKVNNSAGVYILTLNSNNTISTLYPCAVDANNPVPGATSTMPDAAKAKDIIVANRRSNPVAAQDINGFTTFPTPDFSTTPPTPNYFTITGQNKTPENFCVILSKSILDMDLMKKQLEAQTGSINERLVKVFKEESIPYADAQITPESNKVTFNASNSTKNVLPLVFYIKR